jgi:hypothetical protein
MCIGEEGTTLANVTYGECAACSRALYDNADDFSSIANTLLPLSEGKVTWETIR